MARNDYLLLSQYATVGCYTNLVTCVSNTGITSANNLDIATSLAIVMCCCAFFTDLGVDF